MVGRTGVVRRLLSALLPALVVILAPGQSAANAGNEPSLLIASPPGGHPGDTFYLSGVNLLPNHQYVILVACPNWYTPGVLDQGNFEHKADGPTTDAHGNFSKFPMKAIHLHGVNQSGCTIYSDAGQSSVQDPGFGPDIPGSYFIFPPRARLKGCYAHMCPARALSAPRRIHSGLVETITLASWPGAIAHVVLSNRGIAVATRTVPLDAEGHARTKLRVPAGIPLQDRVSVHVDFSLGRYRDTASTSFTVVR